MIKKTFIIYSIVDIVISIIVTISSSKDAKEIIDIACDNWKPLLAEKFAINIVLNQDSIIEESFYKEMRKACTDTQNLKFDEIFGKD